MNALTAPTISSFDQPKGKAVRFPHALLRARQYFNATSARERVTGMAYAWVYRMRPDVTLMQDVPLSSALRGYMAYPNQGRADVTRAMAVWWGGTGQ